MTLENDHFSNHPDLWSGLVTADPDAHVGVMGIPFDNAASFRKGTAFGPSRLRGLTLHLSPCSEEGDPLKLRVKDYGDLEPDLDWARYFQTAEELAAGPLSHPLALFLGGDHSVTIPLIKAFSRSVEGPIGVVHFDAHPDLFDVYSGHTWSHACTARRALELPNLEPRHLPFVGLRSIAREEWDFLQENPAIPVYTARQCYLQGIEAIAEQVVEQLRDVEAVYFTLDIDGLDPSCAPGTGYPEGGGPSTRDLLELLRLVFSELPVRALDLVEIAPPLDLGDITSTTALRIIYEVWGTLQAKEGW